MDIEYSKITSVECLGEFDDYVYDISIADNDPLFFGNDILLHNTDSCISSTSISTHKGDVSVETLFEECPSKWTVGNKEFAHDPSLLVMTYDDGINEPYLGHTNYIYRHKVNKALYDVQDEDGNIITITEDHSIMVERDSKLIEVKPADILPTDVLISIDVK